MSLFHYLGIVAVLGASFMSDEKLKYQSITDNEKTMTEWIIAGKGNKLNITSKSSDGSVLTLVTAKDYTLESFTQKDSKKDYDLQATRTSGTLKVTGKVKDETKTKSYDIGSTPWVQEFAFGFKDFLASKDTEYKFEILRPEDLDMHDMIATKEELEDLKIGNKTYHTQKLKITLQGFKKRFWKGEAWYDVTTHRMLRYKANEGPGTPVTETLFISSSL